MAKYTFIEQTQETVSHVVNAVAKAKPPVKPQYRLVANDKDITDLIRDRFMSLRYTDDIGFESDILEIDLSDHIINEPIEIPATGAELQLYLGYDDVADLKGIFVVDEVQIGEGASRAGYMHIRARATPFDISKGGKSTLQSQKRRIWKQGTKIGDMVSKIAKEHGMEYAVSASLMKIPLPTIDQSNESDINMLLRLARKYDAMVKPAAGKLIFAKRGESKTLGGEQLPTVIVNREDVGSWEVNLAKRSSAGLVIASWHSTGSAKRHLVRVGSGEPVHRIKKLFQSEDSAKAAANAEYTKRQREGTTLTFEMAGRNDMIAEAPLKLIGFRKDVPVDWLIKSVEHTLDVTNGWKMNVQAELPDHLCSL